MSMKLVYHDGYDLNLGGHVFPSRKYRLIRDRLLEEGFATPGDFLEPQPASLEDLLLVHERGWLERLKTGTLRFDEVMQLEIPYSAEMVRGFWLAAGGTTLAARRALDDGIGFNIGGGFHHAFPGHGEGFCAIHDVAVGVRCLQRDGAIERALVLDCDVHHGNGTAGIFHGDPTVFTISLHQFNNYPSAKPSSTIDVHLEDGAGDEEYLAKLAEAYVGPLDAFRPNLVMYIAGADPYRDDQLGGLALTLEGLKRRDRFVFDQALSRKIPVAVTLAGGYAHNVGDTVTIHCNTAKIAKEALESASQRGSKLSSKE